MLSRAINNPGDVQNYFVEKKVEVNNKIVFIGDIYHEQVVEHFKDKCTVPFKEIYVQMDPYVDGLIFIDKKGQ